MEARLYLVWLACRLPIACCRRNMYKKVWDFRKIIVLLCQSIIKQANSKMAALKLYPVGIQTFSEIINRDLRYVDKTEYIYRMAHSGGKHFFLSRPRRFGKSLLASTFQSYFEGKKELFKGLAIEKLEKEWTEYPVLHFSMAGGKHMEKEQLQRYLLYILKMNEERFGIENDAIDPNIRLSSLIQTLYKKWENRWSSSLTNMMPPYWMLSIRRQSLRSCVI